MTEETLFIEALEIADPAGRAAFLDRACAGNSNLRGRLDRLLAEHAQAGSFLGQPAALPPTGPLVAPGDSSTNLRSDAQSAGGVVGPYKLVEVIGEGGMGTVWLARQQEPVKRLVALKVIKAGMDSKSVLARFEAERQALALMDHPHIARVLDAGATPDGRPFFVMELVKGVPITTFCDERKLTPRERLELFVPVCQAIQHAHQKGVIHRDIKPNNVLVALYDGRPVPKVIDFGIAKATGQPLTEKTLVTGLGAVVGTPEYMSPEQAELNQLDIDTRSDVYSLGVLLYELLTGTTPLQRKRLKEAALLEVLRLVREEEPPRPSTRLSTTDELPSIAANRGVEPRQLSGLVRGELDWIVMKALEKDRGRRYETAIGFAADVLRFLAGEAVLAVPPSAGYRLRKFARRNKGPALAASVVLLALVGGVAGLVIGLVRADEQRRAAESSAAAERQAKLDAERAAEAEKAAKDTAERRLAQIEKGVELFAGLVRGLDPRGAERGAPPLFEQLRDRAAKAADELTGEAVGDAEVVARLQTLLGSTLREMGNPVKAVEVLERARATREAKLGLAHSDTLKTLTELALAYRNARKLTESIALFEQVQNTLSKKSPADYPGDKSYEWMLVECHSHRGIALADQGKFAAAADAFREAVRVALKLGDDRRAQVKLSACYDGLGNVLLELNKLADAKEAYLTALDIKERLTRQFPTSLDYAVSLGGGYCNFGHLVSDSGRPAEAVAWFEKAIAQLEPVLTEEKRTIIVRQFLGNSHYGRALAFARLGRDAEAIPDWERALELGNSSTPEVIRSGLARSRLGRAQADKNAAACRAAAAEYEAVKGTDAEWLYNAACNRAVCAAVIPVDPKTPAAVATGLAKEEADKAMAWLVKAVAAGWGDVAHMKTDIALSPLRDRADFKKLMTELEAKKK